MFRRAGSIADLSVGIVLVNEILHHRPALKNTLRAIQNCGNTAVGVDLQEPVFLLFIAANVNALNFVVQAKFFEDDVSLPA